MTTFREIQNKQHIINRSDVVLYLVKIKTLHQTDSFMEKYISPEAAEKLLTLVVLHKRDVIFPLTDCCRFQSFTFPPTYRSIKQQNLKSGSICTKPVNLVQSSQTCSLSVNLNNYFRKHELNFKLVTKLNRAMVSEQTDVVCKPW